MPEAATDIPEQMQGIAITAAGEPDVLQPQSFAVPAPGTDEVLIKVAAAGVNRPDCLQRRGLYPAPAGASELPGLEVAGVIAACGSNVSTLRPGDRICALLAGGGYAEYCSVPAGQCLPAPAGISLAAAATLPETCFTVWSNLYDRAQLKAGEKLLVHGGASGIGTTAIQIASALGATVFATAGSDEKVALCEKLGATCAFNYRSDDFLEGIKNATDGYGVDVILDIVGASYLESNVKLLARDGRLVVIGILGGAKGTLNLGLVLSKRLVVTGSTLRARPPEEKQAIAEQLLETVWPHIENGTISPVVQQSFALHEAPAAHQLLEDNAAAGKLVLVVNNELANSVT